MAASSDVVSGDPLVGHHFVVEIGAITGYFISCSGMGSETATIDHKIVSGGTLSIDRKIPGRLSWGDITLRRGVTTNLDFWEWRKQVRDGGVAAARQDGSIIMYDQEGTEIARWNFERAWPVSITGPDVTSDGDEIAMEEVVIAHEYIERVT